MDLHARFAELSPHGGHVALVMHEHRAQLRFARHGQRSGFGRAHRRRERVALAEQAQARQTGVTPEERRAEITNAFRQSDSPEAFRAALKEKGYFLAEVSYRIEPVEGGANVDVVIVINEHAKVKVRTV